MSTPVLAAKAWKTNAELIADVARLYLDDDMLMLDPTYGRGTWWKKWRPRHLVTVDLYKSADLCADFRDLPFDDASFDAVAFDPPYVCAGGRTTTGMADMHDRYGLTLAPTTARGVQETINEGLAEMHRVVKPGGLVLVKMQDYVSSGSLWLGTFHTMNHALGIGFKVVDRFEHITKPRPQPKRQRADGTPTKQLHARRNLSTLFVLKRRRS